MAAGAAPRRVVVEADGGSRGNPGPAAYGAVLRDADSGALLAEHAEAIGEATNNVAEYRGLIAGLEMARAHAPDADVEVRLDSKLVIEQMAGRWKIKHPDMRPLALQAQRLAPAGVTWTWVPREQNAHADRLLNDALDAATGTARRTPRTPPAADAEAQDEQQDGAAQTGNVNPMVGWNADLGEPTHLVLVRHGATSYSLEKRFSGTGGQDLPLDEVGIAQAHAAGEWLRGHGGVQALVTSPLGRCLATAAHLGEVLGLEPQVVEGLRETSFGDWDGHTFAEVREKWPAELDAWLASTSVAPPGGEAFDAVARRVRRTRDGLIAAYPGQTVVAVTHVTPIKLLVRSALGAPLSAIHRMELAPGSVTEIAWYADGHPSLRRFNLVP
ncbi:MAG: bifunctional RNase H/acid phosphatase [Actinomycetota bacterium]|nr:bifunctional RNase H/acid phosphatase [Actinomycetota bacterium]